MMLLNRTNEKTELLLAIKETKNYYSEHVMKGEWYEIIIVATE